MIWHTTLKSRPSSIPMSVPAGLNRWSILRDSKPQLRRSRDCWNCLKPVRGTISDRIRNYWGDVCGCRHWRMRILGIRVESSNHLLGHRRMQITAVDLPMLIPALVLLGEHEQDNKVRQRVVNHVTPGPKRERGIRRWMNGWIEERRAEKYQVLATFLSLLSCPIEENCFFDFGRRTQRVVQMFVHDLWISMYMLIGYCAPMMGSRGNIHKSAMMFTKILYCISFYCILLYCIAFISFHFCFSSSSFIKFDYCYI